MTSTLLRAFYELPGFLRAEGRAGAATVAWSAIRTNEFVPLMRPPPGRRRTIPRRKSPSHALRTSRTADGCATTGSFALASSLLNPRGSVKLIGVRRDSPKAATLGDVTHGQLQSLGHELLACGQGVARREVLA